MGATSGRASPEPTSSLTPFMDGVNEVAVDDCPRVLKCIYWSGELDDALIRLAALSRELDGRYYMRGLVQRWTDEFPTLQANETTLAAMLSKLRRQPRNNVKSARDDNVNSSGADVVADDGWEDV